MVKSEILENSTPDPLLVTEQAKTRAMPWFLAHGMLNSVFSLWTFTGSVFVLFLNELGLAKGQIGCLLSLFPFCGLLALGFAPIIARLGRKRVFIFCYGLRNPVMALLLLLPWFVSNYGNRVAVLFLSAVVAIFAVLRALGESAYYPWMQEFIPNRVRGKLSAWSLLLCLVASGVALVVAGAVIDAGIGVGRYMALIGAGSILGFTSILVMTKVPGGAPIPRGAGTSTHGANMRVALSDRNFTAFLGGMAGQVIGVTMLVAFLPLYLHEEFGLASATVVRLDVVVMVGGVLASLGWGWLSDRIGSRPVLMPAIVLLLILPLGWLLLPRQLPHILVWPIVFYFIFGVALNGVIIASGRLFFNRVSPLEKSTAYMAIYYAWMGVTGGLAPLLAGGILSVATDWRLRMIGVTVDGYTLMFGTAFLFLLSGWFFYGRVQPDGSHTTRTAVRGLMNRMARFKTRVLRKY